MKHEYEAKFLSVDVADLQTKLKALGGWCFSRVAVRRVR